MLSKKTFQSNIGIKYLITMLLEIKYIAKG